MLTWLATKAFSGTSNFEMHGCPAHDGVYVRVDRRVAGEKGYCGGCKATIWGARAAILGILRGAGLEWSSV